MPLNCPDCAALPESLPCFEHYRTTVWDALDALHDGNAIAVTPPLSRA